MSSESLGWMLVVVCSSATCKPYAVPLLGKPHRREKSPPVPAPGERLQAGKGPGGAEQPSGAPRGLPAAAAPSGPGAMRGPCSVPAPAAAAPFRPRHRVPRRDIAPRSIDRSRCSSGPFVRGGVSEPGRTGWGSASSSAGCWPSFQRRGGGCRCCPDSRVFPSPFGSERMSRSPTQIPGVAWQSQRWGYRWAQGSARVCRSSVPAVPLSLPKQPSEPWAERSSCGLQPFPGHLGSGPVFRLTRWALSFSPGRW